MHDAAFDTGLMTIYDDTLRVMYAPGIEETIPEDTSIHYSGNMMER